MPDGSTVYDRMKSNGGFMAGSRHRLIPPDSMRSAPAPSAPVVAPEGSEEGGGERPPNLRDSGDQPETCYDCDWFDGESQCGQFDYPVEPSQVCDAYEPMQEEGGEEGGGQYPGGMAGQPASVSGAPSAGGEAGGGAAPAMAAMMGAMASQPRRQARRGRRRAMRPGPVMPPGV
jgi:hypothetical protein